MDIGITMDGDTLEEKLDARDSKKPEAAWNLARWPRGFSSDPSVRNRVFVACNGYWIGYFLISRDMLYLPEDRKTPYVMLFDTRTWTTIRRLPAKRFRGFTYSVPQEVNGEWTVVRRDPPKEGANP